MTKRGHTEISLPDLPEFNLSYGEHEESIYLQKYGCDDFDCIETISESTPLSSVTQSCEEIAEVPVMGDYPLLPADQCVNYTINDRQKETQNSLPHNIFTTMPTEIATEIKNHLPQTHGRCCPQLPSIIQCVSEHDSPRGAKIKKNNNNHLESKKKNLKERRRYQTIVDNIDEIRRIMQVDRWKFDASTKSGILTSCCDYIRCLEKKLALKQNKIDQLKKKRKNNCTEYVPVNKLNRGKTVDQTIDVESSKGSDSSEVEEKQKPRNNHLITGRHSYEDTNASKSILVTPLETNSFGRSPYFSASKFSSKDFKAIFDSSQLPQMVVSPSGQVITCNETFLNITKQLEVEVCDRTMFTFIKFNILPELYEYIAMILQNNVPTVSSWFLCENTSMPQHEFSIKLTPIFYQKKLLYFHAHAQEPLFQH